MQWSSFALFAIFFLQFVFIVDVVVVVDDQRSSLPLAFNILTACVIIVGEMQWPRRDAYNQHTYDTLIHPIIEGVDRILAGAAFIGILFGMEYQQ